MTGYALGRIDPGKVEIDYEYNSFGPSYQRYFDESYASAYKTIKLKDKDGKIVMRKYDIIRHILVDED